MGRADGERGLAHRERGRRRSGQDRGPGRLEQPVVDHGRSLRVGSTASTQEPAADCYSSVTQASAARSHLGARDAPENLLIPGTGKGRGAGGQRAGTGAVPLAAARIGERFASSLASARNEPGASLDSA